MTQKAYGLLVGMCRIANLPDTGYPANLTYQISGICRISGASLSGQLPDSSTRPKLIFGCFLSTTQRYCFARLASYETIA